MNVLITGGAGFIGSHTADLLAGKNHLVSVIDRLEPQVHPHGRPGYLNDRVEYIWADITLKKTWKDFFRTHDVDAIIHLAARVGIAQSMYEPYRYLKTNTLGTSLLYQSLIEDPAIRKNLKKIVMASSKTIYGEGSYWCAACNVTYNPEMRKESDLVKRIWDFFCPSCGKRLDPVGIREEKPPQNLSIYALTKYDAERMAISFGEAYSIPTTAFRYFNVYGPRQSLSNPYTGVAAIFSNRIKNHKPIILFEDGTQLRDFVYVGDVARVNMAAIESDTSGVFNVGSGEPHSITEIANFLKKIYHSDVNLHVTQEFRKGDTRHDFANISKVQRAMNFSPEIGLETGLKKLVEWAEGEHAEDHFDRAERERLKFLRPGS